MKRITKLSSILFDMAGFGYFMLGVAGLVFVPVIIALTVWAIKLIKKARAARANEERQTNN